MTRDMCGGVVKCLKSIEQKAQTRTTENRSKKVLVVLVCCVVVKVLIKRNRVIIHTIEKKNVRCILLVCLMTE